MNERIRQLADKAGINYHFAFGAPCDAVTDLQLEEFAELIVRECVLEAMDAIHHDTSIRLQVYKHFGIEL